MSKEKLDQLLEKAGKSYSEKNYHEANNLYKKAIDKGAVLTGN
jgi:hypothetical protein